MKYTLLGFLLFLFIIILSLNYKNTIQINGTLDKIDGNNPEGEHYRKTYKSNINDTFSIEGALISTVVQNLTSFYPNVYYYTEEKQISNSPESTMPTNNKSNNETDFGSQFDGFQEQQQQQTLYPIPKPISQNTANIELNASEALSDNLVSMLSGIILESIQTGNPTINNETIQPDSDDINSREDTILVSGKWKMDVENSNITSFNARFVMITSNGTGFHWHSMDNLQTSEKLFLGKDDSATINGELDFFTGNNTTKQPVDTLLAINNLELIQITLLDNDISSHFYGFPIYGTIDSIKIKN